MKISIALATYNGEKYIRDQLRSFSDQTKKPDEIIVSDDCSYDRTIQIIEEFAKDAPFKVKIFKNKLNKGYCSNFNNALMKTTGDLVFLSDQDDVWFKNKINDITNIALKSEALLFMNNAELTDSELNISGLNKIDQMKNLGASQDKFVMGCCSAVKRELLEIVLPIDSSFNAHDTWISWFADFMHAKEVHPQPMQYYRRHESNESHYIANDLNKISNLGLFFNRLNRSFSSDKNSLINSFKQFEIFYESLRNKINIQEYNKYQDKLIEAEKNAKQKLENFQTRIDIRHTFLPLRLFKSSLFFLKGGYNYFSGFKSFLRDIFIN